MAETSAYETISNGRFKGGWITRHYGQPKHNVHALQMEIAQIAYMAEGAPYTFDAGKAERVELCTLARVEDGEPCDLQPPEQQQHVAEGAEQRVPTRASVEAAAEG